MEASWPSRVPPAQKSTSGRDSLQKSKADAGRERVGRFLKFFIAKLVFNRIYIYIDILDTIK